ncbi:hypothetical protein ABI59_07460 [Acidobacteria bacterium Mor1]|nr:hypothetical protein ABI59_07460 [Acidobacteria bacterium Mor1]
MKRATKFCIALQLALMFVALSFAQGADSSPPLDLSPVKPKPPASAGEADTITAVVVRSWNDGNASGWRELNAEWPLYGDTPIEIDITSLGGALSFTYEDLVRIDADVVILSDPAGGLRQYSDEEIAAIERYVMEGHNIIGTYLVFRWVPGSVSADNSGLLPLFGFQRGIALFDGSETISNVFEQQDASSSLFNELPGPTWLSEGYPQSQRPEDLAWGPEELAGARIVATADSNVGIVTVYDAPTYRATYISNMPEFHGGTADKQLLYNAIAYTEQRFVMPSFRTQRASVRLSDPEGDAFQLVAGFALDPSSDGMDPALEEVELQFGGFTQSLPPGSFTCMGSDCVYEGAGPGITRASIQESVLVFEVEGPSLFGAQKQVSIRVTIGNDEGRANIPLQGVLSYTDPGTLDE